MRCVTLCIPVSFPAPFALPLVVMFGEREPKAISPAILGVTYENITSVALTENSNNDLIAHRNRTVV